MNTNLYNIYKDDFKSSRMTYAQLESGHFILEQKTSIKKSNISTSSFCEKQLLQMYARGVFSKPQNQESAQWLGSM